MLKVAIMQPYFFPYIGYWQLIKAVDLFIIYDDVNYIKGGWINRNNILLNDASHFITLSLAQASPYKKISDIEIHPSNNNKQKILSQIESAYRKAPYFQSIFQSINEMININEANLAQYLKKQINDVCNKFSINTKIICSSEINKNNLLKGQDKVIQICHQVNATHYINAIGGKDLYNELNFKEANLKLNFIQSKLVQYKQFSNTFIPNLSIIDLMMFNDQIKLNNFLDFYELV